MNSVRTIAGLLVIFIVAPIWYYLLYRVLEGVNASSVMWLLYWVYVPVAIFAQILAELAKGSTR